MFSKQSVVLVKDGTPRHVTKGEVAICFKDGILTVVDHLGVESQVLTENIAFTNTITFEDGGAVGGNGIIFTFPPYEFVITPPNMTVSRLVDLGDADGTIPVVPQYADLTAANAALSAGDFYWDLDLLKLMVATA